jgi:hypothetical protein
MFDVKDPSLGEKLADVVLNFLTGEVLLRALSILGGSTVAGIILKNAFHGNYTFWDSARRGFSFAPPLGLIGLWFVYLGLRKRSIKDAFRTQSGEDTDKK